MTREYKVGKLRFVYWSWSGWRLQWYKGHRIKLELGYYKTDNAYKGEGR